MDGMSHSRTQEQIDGLGVVPAAPEDDDVQGHAFPADGDGPAPQLLTARLARPLVDEPEPDQA